MNIPDNLKYSDDHEWIMVEGDTARIGLTDYAQEKLGDIVFVELPDEKEKITKGESFGVVESVKSVSDCFSPVNGTILEVNSSLTDSPETINSDCYGEGWIVKIELDAESKAQISKLMSPEDYEKFVSEESSS